MKTCVVVLLTATVLLLQSCIPDPVRTGTVSVSSPEISVSSSTELSGEFIEVTVSSILHLSDDSSYAERSTRFSFGICFIPRRVSTVEGCSPGESFTLPDGIVVRQGEIQVDDIEVVVSRGEYVNIEHKFSFTASESMEITLVGRAEGQTTNSSTRDQDLVYVRFE